MVYIGVDTGVNTGFAVWSVDDKKFLEIKTLKIHQAMERVLDYIQRLGLSEVFVVYEDARLRKWYGSDSNAKMQGAGSVKRDAKVWEDFLKDKKIQHKGIHPLKGATKLDAKLFKSITKYDGVTSEHSRDAAMMVFQLKKNTYQ